MRRQQVVMAGSLALALCGVSARAQASLDACGDINVLASASCKIEVSGGCKTLCTPVHFETVCHTRRYRVCKNQCTLQLPSAECQADCKAGCTGQCTANPGSLDCRANCTGKCQGDCTAYCATSNSSKCLASCKATCSGQCEASCEGQLPSASCDGKCGASCDGSCRITGPYLDCQVQCQDVEIPECETQVKGGCETQCETPEGALFCDGQFIDAADKLRECIDSLNDFLTSLVNVTGSATLTADCAKGHCTITIGGDTSISCAVHPKGAAPGWPWLLLVPAAAVATVGLRRLRRRR